MRNNVFLILIQQLPWLKRRKKKFNGEEELGQYAPHVAPYPI